MKQLSNQSQPIFIEDQNDLSLPPPIFITKTTLRRILQKLEVKTLMELKNSADDSNSKIEPPKI